MAQVKHVFLVDNTFILSPSLRAKALVQHEATLTTGLGRMEFAWDLACANTFKVSDLFLVTAGYRSFRYKRIDGTGADELKKVHAYGPFIGVSFVL